jgi:hypothetical protein
MAGRKDKNTIDYFPHFVNHGKTLFIIESKFGNDGYAAWFKILEMLGKSDNHFIDCRKDEDWEYMSAKIKLMKTRGVNTIEWEIEKHRRMATPTTIITAKNTAPKILSKSSLIHPPK